MRLSALYSALFLAAGVLFASYLSVQRPGWLVLAAPVSLALCVLVGGALDSHLRGGRARPTPAAVILAGTCLLAGSLVASQDPAQLKQLMSTLGACAVAVITQRPRRGCLPRPGAQRH